MNIFQQTHQVHKVNAITQNQISCNTTINNENFRTLWDTILNSNKCDQEQVIFDVTTELKIFEETIWHKLKFLLASSKKWCT